MITKAISSRPTISRLSADEIVTVANLLHRAEQDGADDRADPAGHAADHRHRDAVDRVGRG